MKAGNGSRRTWRCRLPTARRAARRTVVADLGLARSIVAALVEGFRVGEGAATSLDHCLGCGDEFTGLMAETCGADAEAIAAVEAGGAA